MIACAVEARVRWVKVPKGCSPSIEEYTIEPITYLKNIPPLLTELYTIATDLKVAEPQQQEQKKVMARRLLLSVCTEWNISSLAASESTSSTVKVKGLYECDWSWKKFNNALRPFERCGQQGTLHVGLKQPSGGNIVLKYFSSFTELIPNTVRYMIRESEQHALIGTVAQNGGSKILWYNHFR